MIAISGGGTGGHLAIAKSLAGEFKKRGIKTIFIGSTHGQDRAWFENSELFSKTYFLQSSGVVNKKGLAKFTSLVNILKLSFGCKKIFQENEIKAVISVGGYSSAPASFASFLFSKPLFIHEQNAILGRLNALLKPVCKKIYSSYNHSKILDSDKNFNDLEKTCFDYPVAEIFFENARKREKLETIIFLGGSQGASFINSLASNLAPKLLQSGIKIIHQCGEREFQKWSEFYKSKNLEIELVGFSKNLPNLIQKADLCIGRSGASTLWELCANQIPAIFIPFPHAAGDHQFYNAEFLNKQGLCKIIRQDQANAEKILTMINEYDVAKVSERLKNSINKNGVKTIVDDILNIIGK